MPLTFRLIFHGVRSIWIAGLLALIAWLTLVPASQAEKAALGDSLLAEHPMGLAQMRIARAVVHFAPDRAARLLSRASNGEISPELAGMLLRQIAHGPDAEGVQTAITTDQARDAGGAKFVRVGE